MNPITILCQPLYNHVSPLADAYQKDFLWHCTMEGLLQGTLFEVNAYIDDARNKLVDRVLTECPPATHILFMDQDVNLLPSALRMLHEAQKEFVSGVYFFKSEAYQYRPVGWKSLYPPEHLKTFDETGLQKVAAFGMGAALIRTSLLRDMQALYNDKLWYSTVNGGEDLHFCRRMAAMGRAVWLDGRVQAEHIGEQAITIHHYRAALAREQQQ